jgi:hypothetical protein
MNRKWVSWELPTIWLIIVIISPKIALRLPLKTGYHYPLPYIRHSRLMSFNSLTKFSKFADFQAYLCVATVPFSLPHSQPMKSLKLSLSSDVFYPPATI